MSYKKHLFLLIYEEEGKLLVVKKKGWNIWELPSLPISDSKPLNESIEEILSSDIKIDSYKLKDTSSVVNRYELPKEFQSVAGYSGEEQRFKFVKASSEPIIKGKFSEKMWLTPEQLKNHLKIKNLEKNLPQLTIELNRLTSPVERKEDEPEHQKEQDDDSDIYKDTDIDKLF